MAPRGRRCRLEVRSVTVDALRVYPVELACAACRGSTSFPFGLGDSGGVWQDQAPPGSACVSLAAEYLRLPESGEVWQDQGRAFC